MSIYPDSYSRRPTHLDDYRPPSRPAPTWLTPAPATTSLTPYRPRSHSAAPPALHRQYDDREDVRFSHRDVPRRAYTPRGISRGRREDTEMDEIRITRRRSESESQGWSGDSSSSDEWEFAGSDEEDDVEILRRRRSVSRPMAPLIAPVPQIVQEPTIERDIITHYTSVDHGTIDARPHPSPQAPMPAPTLRNRNRNRSRSRHRLSVNITDTSSSEDLVRVSHRHNHRSQSRARATLAAPLHRRCRSTTGIGMDDKEIAATIDARGRFGEAWNGVTREWEVVDVPPGTERVRMDGVGGGRAEVTWGGYDGVRRTRFVMDKEGGPVQYVQKLPRRRERERASDFEIDISSRRLVEPRDPITDIERNMVSRSALRRAGLEFEESRYFFHIKGYLNKDKVADLMAMSRAIAREKKRIRRDRREREGGFVNEKRLSISRHRHRRKD